MGLYENPIDKLLSFDWLYDRSDPDVNLGYPVLFDCMSLAVREKEYRSLFHDWFENWVNLLKDAIDDGLKKGIFRNLDSEPVAWGKTFPASHRWHFSSLQCLTETINDGIDPSFSFVYSFFVPFLFKPFHITPNVPGAGLPSAVWPYREIWLQGNRFRSGQPRRYL